MVRAVVLLVILASLALFVLQNLAPLPLVILGLQTQALPLGVWVLGAIVAGAVTTLAISIFFKVSNSFAAPRSRRRPAAKRPAERVASSASTSFWSSPSSSSSPKPKTPVSSASRYASTSGGDDWEPRPPLEEWEDWDGYEEPAKATPRSQSSAQNYGSSSASSSGEPYGRYANEPTQPVEEWEDWDEYDKEPVDRDRMNRNRMARDPIDDDSGDRASRREADDEFYPPRRTDFEVKQEPKIRSQSGSMYSYSYRDPDESPRQEDVYDAEYRVITPPYRPEEEPSAPVDRASPGDGEDWDDEEDWVEGEDSDIGTLSRDDRKGDRP